MAVINYKMWAPMCAMRGCENTVGYHKMYTKRNGSFGFNWKRCCEEHRTTKKSDVDFFKMARGCENRDGRYGFECTATIQNSCQIDIHHKDGNHNNNADSNIECLCGNCHGLVTLMNGDHLTNYDYNHTLDNTLFSYE